MDLTAKNELQERREEDDYRGRQERWSITAAGSFGGLGKSGSASVLVDAHRTAHSLTFPPKKVGASDCPNSTTHPTHPCPGPRQVSAASLQPACIHVSTYLVDEVLAGIYCATLTRVPCLRWTRRRFWHLRCAAMRCSACYTASTIQRSPCVLELELSIKRGVVGDVICYVPESDL